MSTTALPPHTPSTTTGFDADADVASLKATPKQDYSGQWDKAPEPPPAGPEAPGGASGGPDATGTDGSDGAAPDAAPNAKESAKEFIEVYDILQSYGFSFYSQGMEPQKFKLPTYAKDRAAHHLAKGLEKMGTPELPWWVGLLIALAPPAGINYMTAREYRRAQEEKAKSTADSNAAKARQGQPVEPTTITRQDGTVISMHPVPHSGGTTPPPMPGPGPNPPRNKTPMPLCQQCGTNPVRTRSKKYCSQHCAGVASATRNRQRAAEKKNQPTPAAA